MQWTAIFFETPQIRGHSEDSYPAEGRHPHRKIVPLRPLVEHCCSERFFPAVYQPSPFAPDYTAAKAALHVSSPGLATALGPEGITVNTVCAGTILTTNTENVMNEHAATLGFSEAGAALEQRFATAVWPNPTRRFGRPEEVAAAVCFLASIELCINA
jgi:NAD(P)-dependent dehydrogenase (short-subunit alcohol dehydrogenase family)